LNITTRYIRAIEAIKHAKGCASVQYRGRCTCGRDTRLGRGLHRAVEAAAANWVHDAPEGLDLRQRFSPIGRAAAGLAAFKVHAR